MTAEFEGEKVKERNQRKLKIWWIFVGTQFHVFCPTSSSIGRMKLEDSLRESRVAATPDSHDWPASTLTPDALRAPESGPASDVVLQSKLLDCQSKLLHHITNKSSSAATFAPIFEAACEGLMTSACGAEVKSQRSSVVHHLAHQDVPKEIALHGQRRPVMEGRSVGALCIADGGSIYAHDLESDTGPIGADLKSILGAHGIEAVWAVPVLDNAGTSIGALVFYFSESRAASDEDRRLVEFLADMASHAIVHRHSRAAKKVADERFSVLADNIPGVVYQRIVTPDSQIRYTYISDSAEDLFGVPADEILADPNALFDCHGEGYRETFRDRLIEASRELVIWDVEATIVARDGKRKFTHAIARPLEQPDGTVVWNGVILDTTRTKEAEMRAVAAEAQTREAIVESLNQGIVLFDADGLLAIANTKLKTYFPALAEVLEPGTRLEDFLKAERGLGHFPDNSIGEDQASDTTNFQSVERRLPDGSWLLMQENRVESGETVILYTDISELKKREAALATSNRELQDFASIASHDLQEPLRKIEAFGDRLKSRCGDELGEQGVLYLDRMQGAAARMRSLINDLLSYSRITTKGRPFEPCDLNKIIGDVLTDLEFRIEETGSRIELAELPTIDADPTQIRQLAQNLIGNAMKFGREGTAPEVHVDATVREEGTRPVCELRVADNGIGFEMQYADRIFNIFQRLHGQEEFKGTGIGLATCRKIADRHDGSIRAESVVGEGSTFVVTLPMRQIAGTKETQ